MGLFISQAAAMHATTPITMVAVIRGVGGWALLGVV